jgi:hypothetical protein
MLRECAGLLSRLRHQERNDFLRYEIDKVHETFLHFLDQCGLGLVRTIFHEWHSVAVVNKRVGSFVGLGGLLFIGSALIPRGLVWML